MIDGFARVEIEEASQEAYGMLLGPGLAAGRLRVSASDRTHVALAAAEPEQVRARAARRGLEVNSAGDLVVGGGWALGIEQPAADDTSGGTGIVLDHIVVRSADAQRAVADYGGRLGLDLRLERQAPQWGSRMLFFRCGDAVLEVVVPLDGSHQGPDAVSGIAWRVPDIDRAVQRLGEAGLELSEIRKGRKPGTRVCTVRDARMGLPTLLIQQSRE